MFGRTEPDHDQGEAYFTRIVAWHVGAPEASLEPQAMVIPSRFGMTDHARSRHIGDFIQPHIDDTMPGSEPPTTDDYTRLNNRLRELATNSDAGTSKAIEEVIKEASDVCRAATYIDGPLFLKSLEVVLDLSYLAPGIPACNRIRKQALQLMHLHGVFQRSERQTVDWLQANTPSAIATLRSVFGFDGDPLLSMFLAQAKWAKESVVTKEEIQKITDYNKNRIDEIIRKDRFRRTRLMMAVALGMIGQARKLVADGAKPCLQSVSRGKRKGDRGTALLFTIQRYKQCPLRREFREVFSIRVLLRDMGDV